MENKKACIKSLISNCIFDYRPYLSNDYDFLDNYTSLSIIKEAIIKTSHLSTYGRYDTSPIPYLKSLDLDLDSLYQISKLYIEPPFPLSNCFHEDEYEKDLRHQFIVVSNENIWRCHSANKKLFIDTISGKRKGDIQIRFNDQEKGYFLHGHILDQYKYFDNMLNGEFEQQEFYSFYTLSGSDHVILTFIEGLYTGSFDPKKLSHGNEIEMSDNVNELKSLFDYVSATGLSVLCDILLGENIFEKKAKFFGLEEDEEENEDEDED